MNVYQLALLKRQNGGAEGARAGVGICQTFQVLTA